MDSETVSRFIQNLTTLSHTQGVSYLGISSQVESNGHSWSFNTVVTLNKKRSLGPRFYRVNTETHTYSLDTLFTSKVLKMAIKNTKRGIRSFHLFWQVLVPLNMGAKSTKSTEQVFWISVIDINFFFAKHFILQSWLTYNSIERQQTV